MESTRLSILQRAIMKPVKKSTKCTSQTKWKKIKTFKPPTVPTEPVGVAKQEEEDEK